MISYHTLALILAAVGLTILLFSRKKACAWIMLIMGEDGVYEPYGVFTEVSQIPYDWLEASQLQYLIQERPLDGAWYKFCKDYYEWEPGKVWPAHLRGRQVDAP